MHQDVPPIASPNHSTHHTSLAASITPARTTLSTTPPASPRPAPSGPAAPQSLQITSPASGHIAGHVPLASAESARDALQSARQAQRDWQRRTPHQRAACLARAIPFLIGRKRELLELVLEETGKPHHLAQAEWHALLHALETLVRHAPAALVPRGRALERLGVRRLSHEPIPMGVVLNQSPAWAPLERALGPLLAPLLAGNAAIVAPSHQAPMSAIMAAHALHDAGLPTGVLQVLVGGEEMIDTLREGVDALIYSGAREGACALLAAAAVRLTPTEIHPGASHDVVVLNDADLDRVARALMWSTLAPAGHGPVARTRVHAQLGIYEELLRRLAALVPQLRTGDPCLEQSSPVERGPVCSAQDLARLESLVDDAIGKGARLICGGRALHQCPGHYFLPTVLADVTHAMDIYREDCPGPVLPIAAVRAPAQALEVAATNPHPSLVSIWSGDERLAREMARQLPVSEVAINSALAPHALASALRPPTAPPAGLQERVAHAVRAHTRPRSIRRDLGPLGARMEAMAQDTRPASPLMERAIELAGRHAWIRRLTLALRPTQG